MRLVCNTGTAGRNGSSVSLCLIKIRSTRGHTSGSIELWPAAGFFYGGPLCGLRVPVGGAAANVDPVVGLTFQPRRSWRENKRSHPPILSNRRFLVQALMRQSAGSVTIQFQRRGSFLRVCWFRDSGNMNDNDFHGEFDSVAWGDLCRPWIAGAPRPGYITASIFMVITSKRRY